MPVNNFLRHLHFFKVIMLSKYGYLMLLGAFPDKASPDMDFINESAVQCYVQVVKILLYVLVIYKWSQIDFDVNTYGALCTVSGYNVVYSFSFLRRWSI